MGNFNGIIGFSVIELYEELNRVHGMHDFMKIVIRLIIATILILMPTNRAASFCD